MIDYNQYIGIPWKQGASDYDGADCWGLVAMVLNNALSLSLGHFNQLDCDDRVETFERELAKGLSDENWEHVSVPRELDVVMMLSRVSGRPEHIGVYIGGGQILHSLTRENGISEVHQTRVISTLFRRLEYYRHVG